MLFGIFVFFHSYQSYPLHSPTGTHCHPGPDKGHPWILPHHGPCAQGEPPTHLLRQLPLPHLCLRQPTRPELGLRFHPSLNPPVTFCASETP